MPKQRLVLILGTVLALITAFLVKAWMDQQQAILTDKISTQLKQQQERYMNVLFAKGEIAAGDGIDETDVVVKSIPERQVLPQSVTSLERIQGMVAIADIFQGEPITITKLAYPRAIGGLAEATPVGRRAITISVDNIAAVAGMVQPGDYVDVIVLIAGIPMPLPDGKQMTDNRVIPLFQNVEVLAVGQSTVDAARKTTRYAQGEAEARPQSPLITLSLTPKESGLLAYISESSKIRLVLRNPRDSKLEPPEISDLSALFRYLSPKPAQPEPPPTGYVEVYLGLRKEKRPIRD